MSFAEAKALTVETYKEWSEDSAPRLGAALAYYTILSLAPLLIVVIAVAGFAFGKEAAQGQLFTQIRDMVGVDGARMIENMVENAAKPGQGIIASLVGLVTLLFGASSVVAELRSDLNIIWNVPQKSEGGVMTMIKDRSYALAVVLGCGFLLLVSLVISASLAAAGKFVGSLLPLPEAALQLLNFAVSFAVITGLFAILFKFLPEVKIQWQDVILGAAVTALLFNIGQFGLGMYLGKAGFGSTYGAAGSLIIVLVWVYYSSQIFFFGAEFTQVYTRRHGSQRTAISEPAARTAPARAEALAGHRAAHAASVHRNGVHAGVTGWAGTLIGAALALTRAGKAVRKE